MSRELIEIPIERTKECVYCGAPVEQVDHIVPIARGGSDTSENKMPICAKCNLHKSAKPPIQFLQEVLRANDLPFVWNKIEVEKEFHIGNFNLQVYREDEGYWFRLTNEGKLLLMGQLLALELLGYNIDNFKNDGMMGLLNKIEIVEWLYRGLGNKRALLERL